MMVKALSKHALITPVLAVLMVAVAQTFVQSRLNVMQGAWVEPPAETTTRWDPRLFQALSLGHLPAAVDWLWMRACMDPARAHVLPGQHPSYFYVIDLLTDLDPAFFDAHVGGASILSIIRNDNEGAKDILNKAVRFNEEELPKYPAAFRSREWHQAWAAYLTLGYVWFFELENLPQAALAFSGGARQPNVPQYIKSLGEKLSEPGGQYEVGLRVLNSMIASREEKEPDSPIVSQLKQKRDSLYLSQYVFQLNSMFSGFIEKHPGYSATTAFREFARLNNIPASDPWGGKLILDEKGRIDSTTPRIKVFGLQ